MILSIPCFAFLDEVPVDKQLHFLGGAYIGEFVESRGMPWYMSGLTVFAVSHIKETRDDRYDGADISAAMMGWGINLLFNKIFFPREAIRKHVEEVTKRGQ